MAAKHLLLLPALSLCLYAQDVTRFEDLKPGLPQESTLDGLQKLYGDGVSKLGDDFGLECWAVWDKKTAQKLGQLYFIKHKLFAVERQLGSIDNDEDGIDFVREIYKYLWLRSTPSFFPLDNGSKIPIGREGAATIKVNDISGVGDSLQIFISFAGSKSSLKISVSRYKPGGKSSSTARTTADLTLMETE